MSTVNIRMKRIEEKLDVIINKNNLVQEYDVIRRKREQKDAGKSYKEILEEYEEDFYPRLERIDTKLSALLHGFGFVKDYELFNEECNRRNLEYRIKMADLNKDNQDLISKARLLYANRVYKKGEPVFIKINGKSYWVWID